MQLAFDRISDIFFYLILINFPLIPISWLIISYIIPKSLLERYFKAPHFGPVELDFMSSFPGTLMRGSGYSFICTFPSRGKKRNMSDIRDYAPLWYVYACKFLWHVVFMVFFGLWLLLFFILLAMLPFL